jgi:hypothetical protein
MNGNHSRTRFDRLTLALFAPLAISCAAGDGSPPGYSSQANGQSGSGTSTTGTGGSDSTGTGSPGSGGSSNPGTGGTISPGAGGSGPSAGCSDVAAPADLVSDFETGKADVANVGGRNGSWFVFNDGSGMQTPTKTPNVALPAEMGGACASQYAFHTKGTGFTVWGAGVGATLTPGGGDGGTSKATYDASAYTGIAFMAKVDKTVSVRFSVTDKNTAVEGGLCEDTSDKTSTRRCGDYFGLDLSVDATWKEYTLSFSDSAQNGWGLPEQTMDKAHIYAFHAQVKGAATTPANFELWLDNVHFVK